MIAWVRHLRAADRRRAANDEAIASAVTASTRVSVAAEHLRERTAVLRGLADSFVAGVDAELERTARRPR